ncbi:MAG: SDR family NAD(P)-dependent oxidoreductase [Elusimicrobia bacterium]|nr:SDR family NAD(P)-dependent oxidoreductase [Elusimicrobiota bacterium]
MPTNPPAGPTRVVVTGATSGLGREVAVQLGRRGWRVAITGRRVDELKRTAKLVSDAGGEPLLLPGSVTDEDEVRAHHAAIVAAWGGLDWAILNSGVSDSMSAREFKAELVRWTLDTNVVGVARWLEAVLPGMIAQGSGVVAGVSSLAGLRGLPLSGPYCASKAALNALLESARVDLRGTGVDVVTVTPGFVKSEITARHGEGSMPFLMETPDGAAAIIAGIDARRRIVHFPGPLSYPMKYLVARLPGWLYDPLAARLAHKRWKKPSAEAARVQGENR